MPDFNQNLKSTSFDDVHPPMPLPAGTYNLQLIGSDNDCWEYVESSKKKTPGVAFTVMPISAEEDVDPDLLAEATEHKSLEDFRFSGNNNLRFWFTENSLYMLKDFFENVLEIDTKGKTAEDVIENDIDTQTFKAELSHEFSDDGEKTFMKLGNFTVDA